MKTCVCLSSADDVIKRMKFSMYQNIDEWVDGRALTDVQLDENGLTIPRIAAAWRSHGFKPAMWRIMIGVSQYMDSGMTFCLRPEHLV